MTAATTSKPNTSTMKKIGNIALLAFWIPVGFMAINKMTTPEQPKTEAQQVAAAQAKLRDKLEFDFRMNIVSAAKDPDSVKFSQVWHMTDGTICATYSGKNGFNATIQSQAALIKGKLTYNAKKFVAACK